MTSYRVIEAGNEYEVVETNSLGETNVISRYVDKESARKMSRNLNFGSGFDGWTPDFFNLKYQ